MNIYEKCRFFDNDTMECVHPDAEGEQKPVECIRDECDSFEIECPFCEKIIDCDDLDVDLDEN